MKELSEFRVYKAWVIETKAKGLYFAVKTFSYKLSSVLYALSPWGSFISTNIKLGSYNQSKLWEVGSQGLFIITGNPCAISNVCIWDILNINSFNFINFTWAITVGLAMNQALEQPKVNTDISYPKIVYYSLLIG